MGVLHTKELLDEVHWVLFDVDLVAVFVQLSSFSLQEVVLFESEGEFASGSTLHDFFKRAEAHEDNYLTFDGSGLGGR